MSDSDSEPEECMDLRDQMTAQFLAAQRYSDIITFKPSDDIITKWTSISVDTRRRAALQMKIHVFWFPILLQREQANTILGWALQIGLVNSNEDLNLNQVRKIEAMEAIFRALEKGTLKKEQAKHVFWISNMFNLHPYPGEVLENALNWLERTGEPGIRERIMEFGHPNTGYKALHVMFTEFAIHLQEMGSNLDKRMKMLMVHPSDYLVEKSEEMKKKGNQNFQEQQYENAVKFYSQAIEYYPDNHIIYGNRALCYIRCRKFLKAVRDGKRATLIKPLWAKGHYRYCEALFYLGEIKMAIDANNLARILCKDDQEGLKDLEQQHLKFNTELAEKKVAAPQKTHSKRPNSTNRAPAAQTQPVKPANNIESKVSHNKMEKKSGKNDKAPQAESSKDSKDSKPSKSDVSSRNGKAESNIGAKKKSKNKNQQEEEEVKVEDSKSVVLKELKILVQDAHTALTDLRSRNAEQAFSRAVALVETNTIKELGLSTVDLLLLLYGRASALTEIGQPQELGEAKSILEKIKSFQERTFQCLVFYAIGRLYVKKNSFAVALDQFLDSLQMVKNQITPGKLTWPLTKEIVKETEPDYLKQVLESSVELCKFPPIPDAICRITKCHGHSKAEIYYTDPDFKGFIQISCCQSCIVEYHMSCWKHLKASSFLDKNEKDFLQNPCLTPDCVGEIRCIKIIDPTGLLKCKFEAPDIPKPQTPKKPKVNQKCTSLKKLKSKQDRRLKRKQRKQSFEAKQEVSDEILQENSTAQVQQKAWQLYRDRILLQISQNLELLREEKHLQVSALTGSLKPWLELDSSKGNPIAVRILNWQEEQQQPESTGQIIELLLERKNRVWARVLIELLSKSQDINPKLVSWACRLDNEGLNAAKIFIERYSGHLEELDLAILLDFVPLQEVIIEKLGTRPELFSSIGLTVTEYLKQASPHDMRLFIWTLEEHRDGYDSCHAILDKYFDMMDGHFSVLKKSDDNQNNSPMKTRGRRKRRKEPMLPFVFPSSRSATPGSERDQDFFEDDSLSFLDPDEPFSVPSRLRDQVADFEEHYNNRDRSYLKKILDNNPDATKESLYDYFAQILEEHGPLVAEDPLLVGELQNFPQVAQLKIQQAGGFEDFLLESLRFIKIGNSIGLAKHAVCLQQAARGSRLDDLDDLDLSVDADMDFSDFYGAANASYLDGYSSSQTEVYPVLPNPYMFADSGTVLLTSHHSTSSVLPNDNEELDLYSGENDGVCDMDPSSGAGGDLLKKHAASQTSQESMRSVAVNTEVDERFESVLGDLNKKQKSNKDLQEQIKKMASGCNRVDLQHKADVAQLKEDLETNNTNIQVTNKELEMFQQKLEEEVKKDQKEKKANQEILRALKVEIDELVEENRRLGRSIQQKKSSYGMKLSDFLELSNQSAAEKMSLEDEIERCKTLLTAAARRSQNAQLSVVENNRDQCLFSLHRELAITRTLLTKVNEASHRIPKHEIDLGPARGNTVAKLKDIEKKISAAQSQYQEQMDQVKNGTRFSELLSVNINTQPEPDPEPAAAASGAAAPSSASLLEQPAAEMMAALPQTQHKHPGRTAEPLHVQSTVFGKAMEQLAVMFPDYTRPDLMRYVQELRSVHGGSLSSMGLEDMVDGVTQLILDHQEQLSAARSNAVGRQCATPPLVTPVWQTPGPQRVTQSNALNLEDPCIICHDDMSPEDTCVLDCRHSFHYDCIRSWLKEQSTCPTCRDHALMPDDFPALTSRRRPAP